MSSSHLQIPRTERIRNKSGRLELEVNIPKLVRDAIANLDVDFEGIGEEPG